MRKRRVHKAFCILQAHGISKCIVLYDATFIETPEPQRYAVQRFLIGSFPAVTDDSPLFGP